MLFNSAGVNVKADCYIFIFIFILVFILKTKNDLTDI